MKHKLTVVTKSGQQFVSTTDTPGVCALVADFRFDRGLTIRATDDGGKAFVIAPDVVESLTIDPDPGTEAWAGVKPQKD